MQLYIDAQKDSEPNQWYNTAKKQFHSVTGHLQYREVDAYRLKLNVVDRKKAEATE